MKIIEQIEEVFDYWKKVHDHERARLDQKRARAIRDRLDDGYNADELKLAIWGCKHSRFHQGENDRREVYDEIALIMRDAAHIDRFVRIAEQRAAIMMRREIDEAQRHAQTTAFDPERNRAAALAAFEKLNKFFAAKKASNAENQTH